MNATATEGKICFKILSQNGDDRLTWDRRFLDQVHEARTKFYELRKKGYYAYAPGVGGQPARLLTEFDPNIEEMVFHGMVQGG
jgi:hypothetical protein